MRYICEHGHVTNGEHELIVPRCTILRQARWGPPTVCDGRVSQMSEAEEAAFLVGGVQAYFAMRKER